MTALKNFLTKSKERPAQILKLKQSGIKVVGYVPDGYFPEELAYAANAIPVGLARGGDLEAVTASEAHLFRLLDTFCRSQIGYWALRKELLYQLPDLLVVPITDRNITAIADSWELSTDVQVFKFGVPRYKGVKHAFEYYLEGLELLKESLEKLTGVRITEDSLKQEMEISNKINRLFKEISSSRQSKIPGISGKDFIKLNHASYYADRKDLLSALESISQEIKDGIYAQKEGTRIMLVGSTMAEGDDTVVNLLEKSGANIVIEEFSEGIRPFLPEMNKNGNLIRNLAEVYLEKRVPPAVFHNVVKERCGYLMNMIREYKVDAVVWYSLLYRDCYDREGVLFSRILEKEIGIPFLKISSDYDASETGQLQTRIETFIEMGKGR